ncbi:MAG: bifunctional alpha,alpha-trehalose-phosphate synthase (UDP-forming)/trehalose-phosphatase [Verrucomicrobia bacterium GWC2_42_7]|nr:MAG: bifunctional alpha,alpha-trehalose-phosphate synthase (UDP-forming)/trehalose-phosphatase [Verrucomicrobia bacterium GWC2_42_7]
MRLILVSNRLPISTTKENNKLCFQSSVGGLVTGLSDYINQKVKAEGKKNYLWVGWPGSTIEENKQKKAKEVLLKNFQSVPVFIPESQMDKFYYGFCNRTIWPLFHYYPMLTSFEEKYWKSYQQINEVFMNTLEEIIKPDDVIWIHDYHLMLLPQLIRKKFPTVKIGFFLHIPFPVYEVFRLLPKDWREKILNDLLGADLVGFHTYEYTQYFLHCVQRLLGYEHDMGSLIINNRLVKIDTFPMGINFEKFNNAIQNQEIASEVETLKKSLNGMKSILSIDRLDYTKGILHRLRGYEKFLEEHPEWHEKVVFLLIIVPSRTGIDHYLQIKKQVDEFVGKINGKFGKIGWNPISYQYKSFDFQKLVSFYIIADVGLVTPLRDGMNLVAKEFVASKADKKGVLILSEMAGAIKELCEAVAVNPNNITEIANSLHYSLSMDEEEQKNRNEIMQKRLSNCNVIYWAEDFLQRLQQVHDEKNKLKFNFFTSNDKIKLQTDFKTAKNKLVMLDYDGTLSPLVKHPSLAKPSTDTLTLLKELSLLETMDLVITSGRDKATLNKWFSLPKINLIAEHGIWIKYAGKEWEIQKETTNDWRPQIINILQTYTNRVPGSFIEEKEYSLCWHYRNCYQEVAKIKSKELADDLISFVANKDLQVVQGSKIVEIRNTSVNKGTAALSFLSKKDYDFILAAGDDYTDEDLFAALPQTCYSIKVGMSQSKAKFNIDNCGSLIEILKSLLLL